MAQATKAKKTLSLKGKFSRENFFRTSRNMPTLVELDLGDIEANSDQPRRYFSEESIEELASSIKAYGLLQPILVSRQSEQGGKRPPYVIVAGERRFRACTKLGQATIPVIIIDGHDQEISLIENLQRQDLNPVEEAEAIARLMDERGYTQESVGDILGKKQNTMSALLSIVNLSANFRSWARQQPDLKRSLLIELARLPKKHQREAEAMIRTGEASVKRLRALAKPEVDQPQVKSSDVGSSTDLSPSKRYEQTLGRAQQSLRKLITQKTAVDIDEGLRLEMEELAKEVLVWLDVPYDSLVVPPRKAD